MNFSDIFKSSFLENIASISVFDMVISLTLAFCIGIFIFLIYKKTFSGAMYSSGFAVTLVALTMITTLVILAVTSNVVLSLGMVGALSIVRFRTAIKEPLDIAFLFWAIAAGIVLAAGMIPLAVFGSVMIGIVLLIFANKKFHTNPYIIVLQCENSASEQAAAAFLQKQISRQLDGTIPSTSDGQNADKTSLIDASDISVFDMGAMHGGNNSRGMVKTNNFNREDSSSENTNPFGEEERHFDETPPDIPEDIQSGNDMPQMPIRGENRTISNDNNSGFDSFTIQEESSAMDKNETIRLQPTNTVQKTSVRVIATAVISAVVLACSIAFALLYKRKGY